jgi:hypothetical protein
MTNATKSHQRKLAAQAAATANRRRDHRQLLAWIAFPSLLVAAVVAFALVSGGGAPAPRNGVNAAPPATSGTARAGGIEVEGALIALGDVPLDTTVTPTWTLRNTGDRTVVLGMPHIQVVQGCCPGEAVYADPELAPGEETTLEFPLMMHEGMDGPHHFSLHVPVGSETIELQVTGNFA